MAPSAAAMIVAFLMAVVPIATLRAQSDFGTPYTFSTLAGEAGQSGSVNGTGSAARFGIPIGVTVDTNGNLYVADTGNSSIRKITSAGLVTTLASGFNNPHAIAVDDSGNVFVTVIGSNTIQKVTSNGAVTILAGGSQGSADGTGTAAQFYEPQGLAVDSSGNVFVSDTDNYTIRKITPAGVVTTLAGSPRVAGSKDGTGGAAQFNFPSGIAVDAEGNVYVADEGNQTIRKITSAGVVTTLAGSAGVHGSMDGSGSAALFYTPVGLALDNLGNLYVTDWSNYSIREITSAGAVTTLAGSIGVQGSTDGTGSAALFYQSYGIAVDSLGNIYVADTGNDTIRKGTLALAALPSISVQPTNAAINVGSTATFSIVAAGVPLPGFQWQLNGTDISGATKSTLAITNAQLSDSGTYTVVVTNGSGSVTSNPATLTVITPITYLETTLATLLGASSGPNGVAVDDSGNIYVTAGNAVEKVASSGAVTLVAGSLTASGSADGTGTAASFNGPSGLATDSFGNIYVADSGNNSVRKVTPAGVVTTLAGLIQGNADGIGLAAKFSDPTALTVDGVGNVYVVDTGNNELREIAPNGSTTTLQSASAFTFANTLSANVLQTTYSITGVAVDASGSPYIGVLVTTEMEDSRTFSTSVLKVSGSVSVAQLFEVPGGGTTDLTIGDGAVAASGSSNFFVLSEGNLYQNANQISSLGLTANLTMLIPIAISADTKGRIFEAIPAIQSIVVLTPVGSLPNIAVQPLGGTIAFGESTNLSVEASGTPSPTYQWQVNGVNLAGATSSTYVTKMPGTYDVVVTNTAGSATSNPAVVAAATRLMNISSRAFVGIDANIEIAGFVVSGPPGSTEQLLIRGAGPSLAQYGISSPLAQPVLTLFNSAGTQVASNTGWNTASNAAAIAAAFTTTGAFAFPLDSADSALLVALPPGAYTAQITGSNSTTGVALAEVYELAGGSPELVNISTRAFVGTGTRVAIGGFVVTGSRNAKVLIRAVGPTLSQFGVSGVLAQPSLSVVDSSGNSVASNTGWSANTDSATIASEMAAVGAFALPDGSADCALLLTLPPGPYTAVISGVNDTSGLALVEVYQAP